MHLEISLSSQFFFLQFETAERNAQGAQYFAGWHKWGLSIELLRAQWVPWSVALVASFIDNGYKQINSTWNIHIVKEFLWGHIKKNNEFPILLCGTKQHGGKGNVSMEYSYL